MPSGPRKLCRNGRSPRQSVCDEKSGPPSWPCEVRAGGGAEGERQAGSVRARKNGQVKVRDCCR